MVMKYRIGQRLALTFLFKLPFTSKSHCMVGLDDNTYLLAGGERNDFTRYVM